MPHIVSSLPLMIMVFFCIYSQDEVMAFHRVQDHAIFMKLMYKKLLSLVLILMECLQLFFLSSAKFLFMLTRI